MGVLFDVVFEVMVVFGSFSLDLINDSEDVDGFIWYFGDGNSSMEVEFSYIYVVDGVYIIMLIVNSVCGIDIV